MQIKTPKESLTILTDMVLPAETNPLNNLFGGELLARMDRASSIAAQRHSRRIVVTASVNHVAFNKAVPVGSVVTVEAKVSRAFKSSGLSFRACIPKIIMLISSVMFSGCQPSFSGNKPYFFSLLFEGSKISSSDPVTS